VICPRASALVRLGLAEIHKCHPPFTTWLAGTPIESFEIMFDVCSHCLLCLWLIELIRKSQNQAPQMQPLRSGVAINILQCCCYEASSAKYSGSFIDRLVATASELPPQYEAMSEHEEFHDDFCEVNEHRWKPNTASLCRRGSYGGRACGARDVLLDLSRCFVTLHVARSSEV